MEEYSFPYSATNRMNQLSTICLQKSNNNLDISSKLPPMSVNSLCQQKPSSEYEKHVIGTQRKKRIQANVVLKELLKEITDDDNKSIKVDKSHDFKPDNCSEFSNYSYDLSLENTPEEKTDSNTYPVTSESTYFSKYTNSTSMELSNSNIFSNILFKKTKTTNKKKFSIKGFSNNPFISETFWTVNNLPIILPKERRFNGILDCNHKFKKIRKDLPSRRIQINTQIKNNKTNSNMYNTISTQNVEKKRKNSANLLSSNNLNTNIDDENLVSQPKSDTNTISGNKSFKSIHVNTTMLWKQAIKKIITQNNRQKEMPQKYPYRVSRKSIAQGGGRSAQNRRSTVLHHGHNLLQKIALPPARLSLTKPCKKEICNILSSSLRILMSGLSYETVLELNMTKILMNYIKKKLKEYLKIPQCRYIVHAVTIQKSGQTFAYASLPFYNEKTDYSITEKLSSKNCVTISSIFLLEKERELFKK